MIRPAVTPLRNCRAASLSLALFCLMAPPFGTAHADHNPDVVRATARQVLADGYFQTRTPGQRESESPATEGEPAAPEERRIEENSQAPQAIDLRNASTAAKIGTAFLWLLAAVAGLLLAFHAFRWLRASWNRRNRTDGVPVTVRVNPAQPDEQPLSAADRMATAGQTADAVRRLLLAAIDGLRRRSGGTATALSQTAREVMRAPMPARARAALSILVESEERSRFGGHLVDTATYRACRVCYIRFAAWLGLPTA